MFFDNVRVPVANRLGEENDGWSVAKYLLTYERGGRYAPGLFGQLAKLAEEAPEDPVLRERLRREAVTLEALEAQLAQGKVELTPPKASASASLSVTMNSMSSGS